MGAVAGTPWLCFQPTARILVWHVPGMRLPARGISRSFAYPCQLCRKFHPVSPPVRPESCWSYARKRHECQVLSRIQRSCSQESPCAWGCVSRVCSRRRRRADWLGLAAVWVDWTRSAAVRVDWLGLAALRNVSDENGQSVESESAQRPIPSKGPARRPISSAHKGTASKCPRQTALRIVR